MVVVSSWLEKQRSTEPLAVNSAMRDPPGVRRLAGRVGRRCGRIIFLGDEPHLEVLLACDSQNLSVGRWRSVGKLRLGRLLFLIGSLLTTCVFFYFLWGNARIQHEPRFQILASLAARRPIEGRLSGMGYAPYEPGSPQGSMYASRRALRTLLGNKSEIAPADLAILEFLTGNVDDGIENLEKACRAERLEAQCLTDLSALYLARSGRDDLIRALKASSRALESGAFLEALYNQALCLQRLSLVSSARAAWLRYLHRDPDSSWADEARHHLQRLPELLQTRSQEKDREALESAALAGDLPALRELVFKDNQAAREYSEEQILGRWGQAWLAGRQGDSSRMLISAREIGKLLGSRHGDQMLARSVAVIDYAASRRASERLANLAKGHSFYWRGLESLDRLNFERCSELFLRAGGLLSAGGSPFAGWARLRGAVCDLQQLRYETALATTTALALWARHNNFPSLQGVSLWSVGLIRSVQARPAEAVVAYQGAGELFAGLGERENLAAVKSLIAASFRDLGDDYLAWRYELEALRLLPYVRQPRKRLLVLDEAQALLRRSGDSVAALPIQDEILTENGAAKQTALVVSGLGDKALLCHELGWTEEAFRAVKEAKLRLETLPESSAKRSLSAFILPIESQLFATSDPLKAIGFITLALQHFDEVDYDYPLAVLRFRRAQAYLRLRSFARAEKDLSASIRILEKQGRQLPEASLQEQFLGQAREIFELMADLQLRLGRPEAALGYIERLRAGSLTGAHHGEYVPLTNLIRHIKEELPERVVLIDYIFIGDELHAWLIRRGSTRHFTLGFKKGSVAQDVAALNQSISNDDRGELGRQSARLRRQLLGTIYPLVEPGEKIVVIPDGPLHRLPFTALWNRSTNRYLIEDHTVASAPSALVYVLASVKSDHVGAQFASILSLGDPSFDRRFWPSLKSLNGARVEAVEVARLYPRAKVLVGHDATVSNFVTYGKGYNVLHLAAHMVVNREQPLLSVLFLSSSDGESGMLYSRDLYHLRFPVTRLVVLAACTSLGEASGGREGLSSLARPFLAGGVPGVVGSLWPVEDLGARDFLSRFHKNLRLQGDPAKALQKTQIDSIYGRALPSAQPASWAAFQLLGS